MKILILILALLTMPAFAKKKAKKSKCKTTIKRYYKKVNKHKKNSVSLLAIGSKTGLEVNTLDSSGFAKTEYEPSVGLMYQHDVGRYRGTVGGALNGSFFVGVGFNW